METPWWGAGALDGSDGGLGAAPIGEVEAAGRGGEVIEEVGCWAGFWGVLVGGGGELEYVWGL